MTHPILAAADAATRCAAPLWPLKHFVAVNPYLGVTGDDFTTATARMSQTAGARPTLPRAFYNAAIVGDRITFADLETALARLDINHLSPATLRRAAAEPDTDPVTLPTITELAADATGTDWPAIVTDRISAFLAAWFDAGQSAWSTPRDEGLYATWLAEAAADRTPEVMGLTGARAGFAALPADHEAMITHAAETLGLTGDAWARYAERRVMALPGWSGHVRYHLWQAQLHGGTSTIAMEFLAVQLAWDLAVLPLVDNWDAAKATFTDAPAPDWTVELALQTAFELSWQRSLAETFEADQPDENNTDRPNVQAAFCIDVRSEVFRRAFETTLPGVETIGFAGFFGASIRHRTLAHEHMGDQCPVLLTPDYETSDTAAPGVAETRRANLRSGTAWGAFKSAAVASFGYVEAIGLVFGPKLAAQSLGLKGSATDVQGAGLSADQAHSIAPEISGIPAEDRIALAKGILAGMSLTAPFARVVMLAGHGATSANNPHATGLDCGACGGHTGEANARVACAILNDPAARAALVADGMDLPEDTVFIPALHNTTTDRVTLYDTEPFAATHGPDFAELQAALARAADLCRSERALLMGGADPATLPERAQDWSQVRPEWGLAGCAAFIAAPRKRTKGCKLSGRAFLHSYDWQQDDGFGVLTLIMTAPLVVASWINLQYYGSTVDNEVLGAGNKVLHNTAGLTTGVFEGNRGDLRPGLALQSLHDGERWIHEPLRLNAVIEAPADAMDSVIEANDGLRELLDNSWVHLFRMDEEGRIAQRYEGVGNWVQVTSEKDRALAA